MKRISPLEIKTTQISQAMIYLLCGLLIGLPLFVSEKMRVIPYLIAILLVMIVFLSFFMAAQSYLKKKSGD